MIYLSLDKDGLKLLYLKRSFMGQYEVSTFEKKHSTDLLQEGKVLNVDVVASAIKEGINSVVGTNQNGKEIYLVLPQKAFSFFRTEVPADIAPTALASFIKDKARATLNIDLDSSLYDSFIEENGGQKKITFYAMDQTTWASYQQVFNLLELKVFTVLPDTLAYFKLFKKTLRKDKKENILYARYEKASVTGYLYDSYGLVSPDIWVEELTDKKTAEAVLKSKTEEYEKEDKKINRLILSGEESEAVRQDTFTKEVGVWTNPLKRIIPNFYEEYTKMLVVNNNKAFPILTFDADFGAFIFSQENKNFSFLKNSAKAAKTPRSLPKVRLPVKELLIFVASFAVSLLILLGLSRTSLKSLPVNLAFNLNKPSSTPSPQPSPTTPPASPTPSLKREDMKIKVLNGSGTAGKATEVKDVLKKKGYGDILTGNADNFDFTATEIQIKASKKDLESMLKEDLKDHTTKIKVSTLPEKDPADAVITFGTDFK